MLHILFTILKIPFILLAVILFLFLLFMVLVLFVPVRYRIAAKKDANIYAAGKITWLLHMVTVLFEYSENKVHFRMKLFGYSLFGEKSSKRRGRRKKDALDPDDMDVQNIYPEIAEQTDDGPDFDEQETQREPEKTEDINDMEELGAENEPDEPDITDEQNIMDEPDADICILLKLWHKIKIFFERLLERLRNINEAIQSFKSKLDYYKRMWYDNHTQASWRHLKKEIVYLLRHIRPRKADGWVRIGLDDPAATGQVLGLLCILQSLSGNHLIAEADFNEKVFEGDFQLNGHIRFCHFLKVVFALLIDKHCRITFKRIRKII